jgi:hypothetical protein
MAGPRDLIGWLNLERFQVASGRPAAPAVRERFTGHEVALALSGRLEGPRAEVMLDMAAQPARWMPVNSSRAFRDVGRYADRVPTILSQIRNGGDPEEIGRRLSPLGGAWPVRRTVEIASDLIARELNR